MDHAASKAEIRPLLDTRDVCNLLGVSKTTVKRWYQHGEMPEPQRFGRRLLRWDEQQIRSWLQQEQR